MKSTLFQFRALARNITAVSDSLAPDIGHDLIYQCQNSFQSLSASDTSSYRQVCVKFKVFSKSFLLFSRSENLYKILIYTLKYYFGNVGLLYLKYWF